MGEGGKGECLTEGVWRVRRREGVREGITKAGREGRGRREGGGRREVGRKGGRVGGTE